MFRKTITLDTRTFKHSRLNNEHHWRDLCDHLMRKRIFTLIMNKVYIRVQKIMRKFEVANHLALIVCLVANKHRVQRKNKMAI